MEHVGMFARVEGDRIIVTRERQIPSADGGLEKTVLGEVAATRDEWRTILPSLVKMTSSS